MTTTDLLLFYIALGIILLIFVLLALPTMITRQRKGKTAK